jgi:peptide/nickel transport system ATP-binding protein
VTETSSQAPLLSVRDLTVRFETTEGNVHAVNGLSFDVNAGETLAIVGESGSGKSVSALAVMALLPPEAQVTGSVQLRGRELLDLTDREMRRIRGREIAMVFQDAMTSLDPVFSVGNQIVEALRAHDRTLKPKAALERAVELLDVVGIAAPADRVHNFPHEMSGGMRQRAMIAIAIANNPDVLIADEPTTALDVTIQAQVMEALEAARAATGAALVLITHDLGLVAEHADRVHVMYGGQTFEAGTTEDVFYRSQNPYTLGLMRSIPRSDGRSARLQLIRGAPPNAIMEPVGCVFSPRCDYAQDICGTTPPPLVEVSDDHESRCHFANEIDAGVPSSNDVALSVAVGEARVEDPEPLLVVENLVKHFEVRKGVLRRDGRVVRAVDGVSLHVDVQESVGIVGESGSGKTTLARCILRMIEPTSGSVRYRGEELTAADPKRMRELRRELQLVFQDPYASLNPRMTVQELISEPLRVQGWSRRDARVRVLDLLEDVGLAREHATRYPHEFSGGQRQRIGIARSLALDPGLLILDEPVSALDVSVQAQVLNMLSELQDKLQVTYVFIAHDLAVVRHVSDRVVVMYLGQIVESAEREELYERPAHPYTHSLMSAIPLPDPAVARSRRRILLRGDVPDPSNVPTGCRFHPRCPMAQAVCREIEPELIDIGSGHEAACHFPLGPGDRLEDRASALQD